MHHRTVIRNQLKSTLLNETKCDDRIYVSRMQPHLIDNLPVINLYTLLDTNDISYERSTAPVEQRRELEIVINIKQQLADYRDVNDITTYIDEISFDVEKLIAHSDNLKKSCAEIHLSRTQIFIDDTAENIIASCDMTYFATYYLSFNVANKNLHEFITAHDDINYDDAKTSQTYRVN